MSFLVFTALLIAISWFLAPLFWASSMLALGRRIAGLSSAWLETRYGQWHYLHGGKGPLLIAIHGFGGDADNWLRIAPALTRKFRVIAPDLPGFGRSTKGEHLAFDIDSQVERLHGFVQALGVSPVVLVGNSMGGWISAAYAARYPGEIRGLWLLAPLGVKDSEKSSLQLSIDRNEQSPFQTAGLKQFRQQILIPMFGRLPWIPYPLQVFYAKEAEKLASNANSRFDQVRHESKALESIASLIQVPVLLQWGTRDNAVDVSGVTALKNSIADLAVEIQDEVGHLPMLETPAESVRFFMEFCARNKLP